MRRSGRDVQWTKGEHGYFTGSVGSGGSGGMGGFIEQPGGTVQPRLYSNGGGKGKKPDRTLQDFQKNQESFESAVASGTVSTKLDKKAQSAHKQGSPAFNERVAKGEIPSYTTLSNMKVQTIINKHNSDGTLYFVKGQYRRVIVETENIGMFGDRHTKTYLPTNRATIHYSKHGAHLVPAHPEGE